jgi:hypothetical protein
LHRRLSKLELFEQMRREYEHGVGTIAGVARKFGVHRRMVRQALASAIPPERKKAVRESPQLGPLKGFIEGILEADRKAPRKQRHTAHRIWQRIRQERPEVQYLRAAWKVNRWGYSPQKPLFGLYLFVEESAARALARSA